MVGAMRPGERKQCEPTMLLSTRTCTLPFLAVCALTLATCGMNPFDTLITDEGRLFVMTEKDIAIDGDIADWKGIPSLVASHTRSDACPSSLTLTNARIAKESNRYSALFLFRDDVRDVLAEGNACIAFEVSDTEDAGVGISITTIAWYDAQSNTWNASYSYDMRLFVLYMDGPTAAGSNAVELSFSSEVVTTLVTNEMFYVRFLVWNGTNVTVGSAYDTTPPLLVY